MTEDKPQIIIPENGEITPADVKKRFDKIDTILVTVVVAVVIALISILVAVFGIFLDQMRYNNSAYKEYSEKIETLNSIRDSNTKLFQENKQNQELISNQQKQILQLLNKEK